MIVKNLVLFKLICINYEYHLKKKKIVFCKNEKKNENNCLMIES